MGLLQRKLVWIIIPFEIICIIAIVYYLYSILVLEKNVLGTNTVYSTISKQDIISLPSSELAYYYEFEPNTNSDFNPDWESKKIVFNINSDTLNERFNYTTERPENTYRIITLGDSFTFGLGVNTNDNWPEQLEDMLNKTRPCDTIKKFEVINLGMPGYGVEYISHRYETRGTKYNPDLLIWLESGAGFDRVNELFEKYRNYFEQNMSDSEKMSGWKQGDFYPVWRKSQEELYKNYTYDQLSEMVGHSWERFFKIKDSKPVIVVTFNDLEDKQMSQLANWTSNKEGAVLYNLNQFLDPKKYSLPDGHPNKKGHKMLAENIYGFLKDNQYISCNNDIRLK